MRACDARWGGERELQHCWKGGGNKDGGVTPLKPKDVNPGEPSVHNSSSRAEGKSAVQTSMRLLASSPHRLQQTRDVPMEF
ncbi:hypothetical protein Q8A67_006145 [Cirrhinus molitorella]|uniref:Uncharacterized protein n=1 Tax=Cirrhinus molitorella TaxID=172907 RepID=A0AA88Q9X6_9TELE|nr:hypothetical protein Q8A67_006145 [Cirrhinus molitorella]